jgi:predicted Zn-dependent protease
MRLAATYYDGKTAKGHLVEVAVGCDRLHIVGSGIERDYLLKDVDVRPPLAGTARYFLLPDGGQCEVTDAATFDALMASGTVRVRAGQWVDRLERRALYVIGALALLAAILFGVVVYGLPLLAKTIATGINPAVEARIGEQSLAMLDRLAFEPTILNDDHRTRLEQRFAALVQISQESWRPRLEFRASPQIGPNAFTLPGGTIVLLDELVSLAQHDEEILCVLAHEMGHVSERHILRSVIQDSGTALLIAAVLGDLFSASSYAAALPTAALQSAYSRDFEREADGYAVALMTRAGIAREHYANILRRLADRPHAENERYLNFLQSHPTTPERLERILGS